MLLTKDNLIKFIREKKAVLPSQIAEEFETTTTIASATLSELAKEKKILITDLKLSSSPFYYDPSQKEILEKIGEEHLSNYSKEAFLKLKKYKLLPKNFLSIQENLAIEKLTDFQKSFSFNYEGKEYFFYIWFLEDFEKRIEEIKKAIIKKSQMKNEEKVKNEKVVEKKEIEDKKKTLPKKNLQIDEQKVLEFFRQNNLTQTNKEKKDKGIFYKAELLLEKIKVHFDCFYFKKLNLNNLVEFQNLTNKPKIIFTNSCPKNCLKFSEDIKNLTLIIF